MPDCQKIYGALKDSQVHGHNRCMRRLPATCVRFGCSNIGVLYAAACKPCVCYAYGSLWIFGPNAHKVDASLRCWWAGGVTHQGPTFLRQLSGKIAIDVLHTLVTALDDDLDRELLE